MTYFANAKLACSCDDYNNYYGAVHVHIHVHVEYILSRDKILCKECKEGLIWNGSMRKYTDLLIFIHIQYST